MAMICQTSTKLLPLSIRAKYSSPNGAEVTEFALPPLPVVSVRNNCDITAPVVVSIENAETYPGVVVVRERVAACM